MSRTFTIEKLRFIVTDHCEISMKERGVTIEDIMKTVKYGTKKEYERGADGAITMVRKIEDHSTHRVGLRMSKSGVVVSTTYFTGKLDNGFTHEH
jgi:hypothetical protein